MEQAEKTRRGMEAVKRRVEEALRGMKKRAKRRRKQRRRKGVEWPIRPRLPLPRGHHIRVHEDVAGCSGDDAEQNRERERDGGHVLGADEERRGRGGNHVAFERVYARGL